jgi:hypothetical protein
MKHLSKEIDGLIKDSRHSIYNLPNKRYTQDVIPHLLKHYMMLEASGEGEDGPDSDFHLMCLDLKTAINSLPQMERRAVLLRIQGYPVWGKSSIGFQLGIRSKKETRDLMQRAYKLISEALEG